MKRFEDKKNKPSSATTEKTASQTSNDASTTKITQKKKIRQEAKLGLRGLSRKSAR